MHHSTIQPIPTPPMENPEETEEDSHVANRTPPAPLPTLAPLQLPLLTRREPRAPPYLPHLRWRDPTGPRQTTKPRTTATKLYRELKQTKQYHDRQIDTLTFLTRHDTIPDGLQIHIQPSFTLDPDFTKNWNDTLQRTSQTLMDLLTTQHRIRSNDPRHQNSTHSTRHICTGR